jgi:tetratricopeptide (TPR) repeat protein
MNYVRFFLSILLSVLLVSCGGSYTKNETILRAESLMSSSADSAFCLLSSVSHPEKLPKVDYAAWCLQYTYAQYKLCKDIKSDKIIRVSVDYYRYTNLSRQSGTAYYLFGCVLKSNKKRKDALLAFKEADNLLQNTTENDLKGLVKFNIGDIYFDDEIFDQSLSYYKKALNYFIASKNLKYQAYAYRKISDMYNQLDHPFKRVMYYSDLALKLSKQAGDTLNYYSILAQQGELLYDKDYARAKEYLLKGFQHFPVLRPNYATLLSYTYSKLHKQDSARFYLNISVKDTLESKYKVIQYFIGAYIAKDEGNIDKAFKLYEKAYSIRNTFFKETIRNQLYRLDKQYDLTQKERENTALKISNRNEVIVITLFIIIFLIGMIIFTVIHSRNKRYIINCSMENLRLEYEIEVKKTENVEKQALLLSKIQNKIDNTLRLNRLNMGISASERMEAFLTELSTQSIITDKEWQDYIKEVNQIFDNKIKNLEDVNYLLTSNDIKVITLICLKVDISDCCSLLNMNKNTMYHRRKIIKERIGINKDMDLESWLLQYVESKPIQ